ncbi:hypothetical protein [Streptomyces sp. S1]|uniref:hypothetical protein n=1 Tax=Streptomyces sp. S1 TaxID=718288 RepID=UPI003D72F0AB
MRLEIRRQIYKVKYEALEWLCIAEKAEDWGSGWPLDSDAAREAVALWSRAAYDAAISDREVLALAMPPEWANGLLRMLMEAEGDDEFPGGLLPSLIKQLRGQNRRRRLPK